MKRARLRTLLADGRLDEVVELAGGSRRLLGHLVAETFHPDPEMSWRAVEAMGAAAERIADEDPAFVRQHLRRLHWLITEESGGICWRSPEAMAEIVGRRPDLYADYAPIVVHLILEMAEEDLDHFRAGILWAIGRLGPRARDVGEEALPSVVAALDHEDPQIRGLAVWALGQVGEAEALRRRSDLMDDEGEVALYRDGGLSHITVARLTAEALGGAGDG